MARRASNPPDDGNLRAGLHVVRVDGAIGPTGEIYGGDDPQTALIVMLSVLQTRRDDIREHWRFLLEQTSAPSPLGRPPILACHFEQTLSSVFCATVNSRGQRHLPIATPKHTANPWTHYFVTLEQALLDIVNSARIEWPKLSARTRALAIDEVQQRVRRIAHQEIALLDAILLEQRSASLPDRSDLPQ